MIDLISRQEAIEAVQYAMRNGGEWRPALEAVPVKVRIEESAGGGGNCGGAHEILYCSALSDDEVKQPCIEGPCSFSCEKEDTQPPQPETYTHDAAWWKEHHDMGFESPIYDLFKALGVYDDEEDDPNGQL